MILSFVIKSTAGIFLAENIKYQYLRTVRVRNQAKGIQFRYIRAG